ncbi:MAG: RluA family pseudouridine synthase [bacterium]|nr:RluA family pseudouridine synthase [bacterium]
MQTKIVTAERPFERADIFVAEKMGISRSLSAKMLEQGFVTTNGRLLKKRDKIPEGTQVRVLLEDPKPLDVTPENIELDVVYEDECLLVVNKPKGMVVHPAPGNSSGTLVNALLSHCKDSLSGINGVLRPGIVHRIDKNTSGLLIVAKNDQAHNFLAQQIKQHTFTREYEAVVYGNLKADSGKIDAPIGRHPIKRKQMAVVSKNSKNAVTEYTVINRFEGFTHIRLRLQTGRTHQIRVHMSYIGHPVAGDEVYGPRKTIKQLNGQCLHAKKIGFIHPRTHEYLEFDSELPKYFTDFLKKVQGSNGDF